MAEPKIAVKEVNDWVRSEKFRVQREEKKKYPKHKVTLMFDEPMLTGIENGFALTITYKVMATLGTSRMDKFGCIAVAL